MNKEEKVKRRKRRVRSKVYGTKARPRLSVFRSSKFTYVQLIDDDKGVTLAGLSSRGLKSDKGVGDKKAKALLVGEGIAKIALKKKITKVVFDRSSYRYHGRVKAVADGARKGGLEF